MLRRTECEGYRVFDRPTTINLNRLTIIFGKNNSGKTTITRLPLFIRAALSRPELFALSDDSGLRFASSFRDLANLHEPHPALSYAIADDRGHELTVDLLRVASGLEETVQLRRITGGDYSLEFAVGAITDESGDFGLEDGSLASAPPELLAVRSELKQSLARVIHVPSARPHVRSVYESRRVGTPSVAEVPHMLREYPILADEVSRWLVANLDGVNLEVEHSDFGFRLVTGPSSSPVNFASTGRGCQAVLPVATLAKALSLGLIDLDMLVVEEPETHLHPAAHGAVAELLAEASEHTQVIAETHSENFILRLRRRVAEGALDNTLIGLVYVTEAQDIIHIDIDRAGGVSDWPVGVFEEDIQEAQAIIEARLRQTKE